MSTGENLPVLRMDPDRAHFHGVGEDHREG